MKYLVGLRATFNNVLFLGFSVILITWLSVFLYGTFYYFYIPAIEHTRPVYLQFDTTCPSGICSYPSANVTFVNRGHRKLLTRGQHYKIVLDLEMPESDVNRRLDPGMFMVKLSTYDEGGVILQSSFRPVLMVYKSPLLRYFSTFFFSPFLLAGASSEKQYLTVSLFENYQEDPYRPAYGAVIEVHNRVLEIYSMTLQIHAHFSGLRYMMYYWPGLSATVGVSTNFYFLSMVALFSWYRFLKWQSKNSSTHGNEKCKGDLDYYEPIPLKKTGHTSNPLSQLPESKLPKAKESFDKLKELSCFPESKFKSVEEQLPKQFLLDTTHHTKILEGDVTQGLMTPIKEESTDSLDTTPNSDDECNIKEESSLESELRKRK